MEGEKKSACALCLIYVVTFACTVCVFIQKKNTNPSRNSYIFFKLGHFGGFGRTCWHFGDDLFAWFVFVVAISVDKLWFCLFAVCLLFVYSSFVSLLLFVSVCLLFLPFVFLSCLNLRAWVCVMCARELTLPLHPPSHKISPVPSLPSQKTRFAWLRFVWLRFVWLRFVWL